MAKGKLELAGWQPAGWQIYYKGMGWCPLPPNDTDSFREHLRKDGYQLRQVFALKPGAKKKPKLRPVNPSDKIKVMSWDPSNLPKGGRRKRARNVLACDGKTVETALKKGRRAASSAANTRPTPQTVRLLRELKIIKTIPA
jgi:hypothetical protein